MNSSITEPSFTFCYYTAAADFFATAASQLSYRRDCCRRIDVIKQRKHLSTPNVGTAGVWVGLTPNYKSHTGKITQTY
ncbi:MAG: hypothetical protein KME26_12525 [Oscillatoria princeps RMCB-10]|nr:hypothetical protein [Oscillatoria princeps RMCB-10]